MELRFRDQFRPVSPRKRPEIKGVLGNSLVYGTGDAFEGTGAVVGPTAGEQGAEVANSITPNGSACCSTANSRTVRIAGSRRVCATPGCASRPLSKMSTIARRAVSIARALAQNPEAILYDEPTTMVDPIMAAHMGDLIARLKEAFHKTSIVVTHDTHLARKLADKVVFLQDGKSTVFNSWAEFENSKDPFFHNFLMQDNLIPALDVTL